MKSIKRFLKRFLTGLTLCFLLFVAVNFGIYLVGVAMEQNGIRGDNPPARLVQQTAESLTRTKQGGYALPESLQLELKQQKAWAMLLNESGKVVWQKDLPNEIPTSYTAAEIAKFSRYYLKDYPVYCWESDGKLMVLGFPKDSYIKFPLDYSYHQFWSMLHWVELLLGVNVVLLIALYALLSWRTVKPVQAILEGIESLSHGESVHLQEKGLFSEIASRINSVSALLQNRDEALKTKEKARVEWISGISHDIRTPLSMIMGYAGEMADAPELPEQVRGRCSLICTQAVKLRNLVSDLNLVSKLEYSMQPINSRPLRAAKLVREAVSEFLNGGVDEKFEFHTDLVDETARISGDERLLKRAITNLLQNSVSHNPSGCKITVSMRTWENTCILTVSDSGAGMDSARMEQLMRQIRFDHGSFPAQEHGLGLRIVNHIAKAHQGTFSLKSEPGLGTAAELSFPLCSPRPPVAR